MNWSRVIILIKFSQDKMDFWIEGIAVSFISIFGIFGEILFKFRKYSSIKLF